MGLINRLVVLGFEISYILVILFLNILCRFCLNGIILFLRFLLIEIDIQ